MNEKIKTNFTELNDYTCRWHHPRVCDAGIIDREGITRGIWQVETEMLKGRLDPQKQNSLYSLHTSYCTRRRRVSLRIHVWIILVISSKRQNKRSHSDKRNTMTQGYGASLHGDPRVKASLETCERSEFLSSDHHSVTWCILVHSQGWFRKVRDG